MNEYLLYLGAAIFIGISAAITNLDFNDYLSSTIEVDSEESYQVYWDNDQPILMQTSQFNSDKAKQKPWQTDF
ncbi:MAG: hypothetical protein ACI822_002369 [Gammaproteobacteria bacterium]|jgi:hypothetical protein